jgi:hypothetical protein
MANPSAPPAAPAAALLNETQAAERLNISPRTLQAWRVRGHGPGFVKLGGAVRYRPTDLDAFIDGAARRNTAA